MNYLQTTVLILSLSSCSSPAEKHNRKFESLPSELHQHFDSAKYLVDKGTLTGKTKTLDVSYGAISCPCAQWFETNFKKDTNTDNKYFYLEPANPTLINADTLFNGEYLPVRVSVTGQFYTKKGYPKNYFPLKGDPKPARVFQYNNIEIIQLGDFSAKKIGL